MFLIRIVTIILVIIKIKIIFENQIIREKIKRTRGKNLPKTTTKLFFFAKVF